VRASVIIPVWNGREYLPACLDALLAQDYPDFEVIVVDNASADGSADLVADKYPQVRLIRNHSNLGFAGGCNTGLRVATGEMMVLLNQDTVVQAGWLQALALCLQNPKVGVAGCKILYPDGETIQHAGGWIEWPLGLAHHYGYGERDNGQWDEPRQVEYVTGAAMAFRRSLLELVGLLDEDFWPGYFEDTDFCFRVRKAGYEVWYVPQAVLTHAETTSLRDTTSVSCAYERGRLRFVLKHLPPSRFLTEFIPAGKKYRLPATQGLDGDPLLLAYLEAIPLAARILRRQWNADRSTIEAVVLALQSMYRSTFRQIWRDVETPTFPPLREFKFCSAVPVVGPLISWLRTTCYNIAARWAVRYLIQQQDAINRDQEALIRDQEALIRSLELRLTEESAFLAREIARLNEELEALKEEQE